MWYGVIGSSFGLSEVGVTMIPLVLTALATAIPTRVGLVNVGGEGQLILGAWAATGVALYFSTGQPWLMLPVMALAGCAGGGLWAAAAALLRRWRGVNEVISTLLANYLAILVVNIFVFGPWKNPQGLGYPYPCLSAMPPSSRPSPALAFTGDSSLPPSRLWSVMSCDPYHLGIQDARRPGGDHGPAYCVGPHSSGRHLAIRGRRTLRHGDAVYPPGALLAGWPPKAVINSGGPENVVYLPGTTSDPVRPRTLYTSTNFVAHLGLLEGWLGRASIPVPWFMTSAACFLWDGFVLDGWRRSGVP